MGVGHTAWAMNPSTKKNETYAVVDLFVKKKHQPFRSKNGHTGSKKSDTTCVSPSEPVNLKTKDLVGL